MAKVPEHTSSLSLDALKRTRRRPARSLDKDSSSQFTIQKNNDADKNVSQVLVVLEKCLSAKKVPNSEPSNIPQKRDVGGR